MLKSRFTRKPPRPIERLEMRILLHEGADLPNLITVADFNAYADEQTAARRLAYSQHTDWGAGPVPSLTVNVSSSPPVLNSVPGAPTAIYLDFDGDATTATNPYDEDLDPSTFSATEVANITECWRQMSIYFAIFNVNVTTAPPSVPAAWDAIGNNISGGYSYVGVFPNSYPQSFNQSSNARTRISGIAHEIGHNFGLGHQSDYDTLGNKTNEYSSGFDSLHGPIMGVDYAQSVHKWFNFHSTYSPGPTQDDLAIISSAIKTYSGGDGFRADDFGGTIATANPLAFGAPTTGIIERMNDADAFSFNSDGGVITIDAVPAAPSAVDLKLSVYASDGTLMATGDAATNDQHLTIGLPAGSYTAIVTSHGSYDDLGQYTITARNLPAGWAPKDIGTVGLSGSSNFDSSSSTFTVAGAGTSLSGSSDSFQFAYEPLRGDGSVTAQVLSLTNTSSGAKAGVMIRDTLAGNARSALIDLTPAGNLEFIRRTTAGATATTTTVPALTAPYWLRLARSGSSFTASYSPDGSSWTPLTAATITMGTNVFIGLAVGSLNSSALNTSTFGSVSFTGTINPAPTYNALPAPANLAVNPGTGIGLALAWDAVAGAANYAIDRSSDGVTYSQIGTSGSTNYADNSLSGALRYFYRVAAIDGASTRSAPSAVATNINRPSAVTALPVASWTNSSVVINWLDTTNETGYRIERSSDGTNFGTLINLAANVRSYVNMNLKAGSVFYYRIVPLSAAGDGVAATVIGQPRMLAVTGQAITSVAPGQISLAWNDINGEADYRIERSTDGSNFFTLTTVAANVVSYNDTTVAPLAEYYYRIIGESPYTIGVYSGVAFSASAAASPPPAPWSSADIGAVYGRGAVGLSGGTFTQISGGNDIGSTADAIYFAYQPLGGDGSIVAHVASIENTASIAKIGIMIRQSLASDSPQFSLSTTPALDTELVYRSGGGSSSTTLSYPGYGPQWVKIVRAGDMFTAYNSTNGISWTALGSPIAVAMSGVVYVGLASTSRNSSQLNRSTFDGVTVTLPASSAPAAPDLNASTDSGVSSSDDITNRNNSSAGSNLQFTINGTSSGATVTLYADGTPIGSAVAGGSTTVVTTNGTTTLSNGAHLITASQIETGKTASPISGSLQLTIDTIPPAVLNSAFAFATGHSLAFQFGEDVSPSLATSDISVLNLGNSQNTSPDSWAWDAGTNTATFTFNAPLPDASYSATLPASAVNDIAGNLMSATSVVNFFVLTGDANHDGAVDTIDFNILAANFSQSGKTFADGDFNYDGTVDTTDFNLLASKFGQTSAASSSVAAAASLTPAAARPDAAKHYSNDDSDLTNLI